MFLGWIDQILAKYGPWTRCGPLSIPDLVHRILNTKIKGSPQKSTTGFMLMNLAVNDYKLIFNKLEWITFLCDVSGGKGGDMNEDKNWLWILCFDKNWAS